MRRVLPALLLLAACGHSSELPPTEGDLVPEVTLSGAALRDHFVVDGRWYLSTRLDAPTGATRVGALFNTDGSAPTMEARGFDAEGDPGAWERLEVTWSENGLHVARADLGLDAYEVELRVAAIEGLRSLTWSAVVPVPAVETEAVGSVRHALRPELTDVVVDRETWGARTTTCGTGDASKTRMAIHHTVTPADSDPITRVRGIQAFHMDTRGWCDVGYHFLISLDGTVYEGRPLDFLGAHVGGHNTGNVGISFIGCFHTSSCMDWTPFEPPDAMLDAAATMVGRISQLYDIPIDPERVKGHRDHTGATTSCPGDNLHARLGDIRERAGGVMVDTPYRASFVSQTFPLASEAFVLAPGAEQSGEIALRNDGTATWFPGETFLATTEPRDGPSALEGSDWVSSSRAATVDGVVAPGGTGRFRFSVRAPFEAGDYPQYFNLVQEGVAWFSDPGQGGPPDDQLQIRVMVSMSGDAGTGTDAGTTPDAGPTDASTADAAGRMGAVSGGCGCRTSGPRSSFPLLSLGLLWLALRRRRP